MNPWRKTLSRQHFPLQFTPPLPVREAMENWTPTFYSDLLELFSCSEICGRKLWLQPWVGKLWKTVDTHFTWGSKKR